MANATTDQAGAVPFAKNDLLPRTDPLQDVLADVRASAREQLAAAWQIEIDRVQEQLANGWPGHLERVFEERFAELSARVGEEFRGQIEAVRAEAAVKARRDTSSDLNHAMRRFRTFENEEEWSRGFVDSTEGFCGRAALFTIQGPALRLAAGRGIAPGARIDNTPLLSAPAFAGVVESRDTIVALRTRGELSGPIAEILGEALEERAYLFPIFGRDRVAAVLYADSAVDGGALELLAAFASAVLEGQSAAPERSGLVTLATEARPTASTVSWASFNPWASFDKDERELHLRAQRFARVRVAEMRLYKSQAVKEGRLHHDLYDALRDDIDRTRDDFRRDFLSSCSTMVDYVHVELLRTLANNDEELLGARYPGALA
jgi:hypothetical protein